MAALIRLVPSPQQADIPARGASTGPQMSPDGPRRAADMSCARPVAACERGSRG
jgi:hypothetical protein